MEIKTKYQLNNCLNQLSEIANYSPIYIYIYSSSKNNKIVDETTIEEWISRKHSTDGFTRGALIEHKLDLDHKTDGLKKAKDQLFNKYPEKLKNNGEFLPRYRIALSQINGSCYIYDALNNNNLIEEINYIEQPKELLKYLESNENIKYDVNEDNILGLADKYYSSNPNAKKIDFFGDHKTKGFIRIENDKFNVYKGDDKSFKHMMDVLNDPTSQKVLGAYYTPDQYTKLATNMVREAIQNSKNEGYDNYIILDRCSGTGNLEKFFSDEELKHCILNTYETKEWLILKALYQNKVFSIIPPTYIKEENNSFLMEGGDALSNKCTNQILESINDFKNKNSVSKLAIIFLENPPYSDSTSNSDKRYTNSNNRSNKTYIKDLMKGYGSQSNDLLNQFIWSANNLFEWYAYVLFAPVKYFKSFQNKYILEKEFKKGYILNRKHFHASESGVSLVYWKNKHMIYDEFTLENPHSISDTNSNIVVKKIKSKISILIKESKKNDEKFLAEMVVQLQIHRQHGMLQTKFLKKGNVKYTKIYEDNLLENLPLFAANFFPLKDFTQKEVLFKSGDLNFAYLKDKQFLQDCLIWTLMTHKQRCEPNSEFYKQGYKKLKLNQNSHKSLWKKWNDLKKEIENEKLKPSNSLYHIDKEYDISDINLDTKKPTWVRVNLHSCISDLKKELDDFYEENIKSKMLKYELVK